jgi:hypothetical protein
MGERPGAARSVSRIARFQEQVPISVGGHGPIRAKRADGLGSLPPIPFRSHAMAMTLVMVLEHDLS